MANAIFQSIWKKTLLKNVTFPPTKSSTAPFMIRFGLKNSNSAITNDPSKYWINTGSYILKYPAVQFLLLLKSVRSLICDLGRCWTSEHFSSYSCSPLNKVYSITLNIYSQITCCISSMTDEIHNELNLWCLYWSFLIKSSHLIL